MKQWITSWAQAHADMSILNKKMKDYTVRLAIANQVAGEEVRIRLSNKEGLAEAKISCATLRVGMGDFHAITFKESQKICLKQGESIVSDALPVTVKAGDIFTISLAFEGCATSGNNLPEKIYCSPKGNYATTARMPIVQPNLALKMNGLGQVLPILSSVEVCTDEKPEVLVCFGDSITQMSLWTKPLAGMLENTIVINKGISGNQLLSDPSGKFMQMYGPAAMKRFQEDVLEVSGVTKVILALGINDLNLTQKESQLAARNASALMQGLLELNQRAKDKGLHTYIATITPPAGNRAYHSFIEPERQKLNQLICESGQFDGVLDFDAVVRDPQDPAYLFDAFDSGDHLHPGVLGGQVMAEYAYSVLSKQEVE